MTTRNAIHHTFTLEREYPLSPETVFEAWANPRIKVRWFAGNPDDYDMDFQPGGIERNSTVHEGKHITWESLYRDIVPNERIVYTSTLSEDDAVCAVSLTSVEFSPHGDGTRIVLVEAGAYLDGREKPEWREKGTGDWLDSLGRHCREKVAS